MAPRNLKIYLASRYSRREEMERVALILKNKGYTITSRWVYGDEEGKYREEIAKMDWEDVMKSDIVVSFTEPYRSLNPGGGRHFETAMGYMIHGQAVLIGPREIVFHHLPGMIQFDNLEEFIDWLEEEPQPDLMEEPYEWYNRYDD